MSGNLRQYYNKRAIQSIIPAYNSGVLHIVVQIQDTVINIPVICWALVEFYAETDNKKGTVITAAFVDPHQKDVGNDESRDNRNACLTTLDEYIQTYPEYKFLGYGGPNAQPLIQRLNKKAEGTSPTEG